MCRAGQPSTSLGEIEATWASEKNLVRQRERDTVHAGLALKQFVVKSTFPQLFDASGSVFNSPVSIT